MANTPSPISMASLTKDAHLSPLITHNEIASKVAKTAASLNKEYKDREITFIVILKGAIVFTSDLIRHLTVPFTLDFIKCSSYVGTKRGPLTISGLDTLYLKGKDVIVIDDIYDTGHTISAVTSQIKTMGPKSLKTLLLLKIKGTATQPDYTLFEIDPGFVVGYGLDHNEHHRGLPDIHLFEKWPPR